MATLGDVGVELARVIALIGEIRDALRIAEDSAKDAQALLATHGAGTGDPEWGQAGGNFADVASGANTLYPRLGRVETSIESLRSSLGLAPKAQPHGSLPTSPARQQAPSSVPPGGPEHVEQLRNALPPRVRPGTGAKTRGAFFTSDAPEVVISLSSGVDTWSAQAAEQLAQHGVRGIPTSVSDVEMKVAAHMAATGITDAVVVINSSPCKGELSCDSLVPVLLPEGSRLTVHGMTRQGMMTRKTYTGGASWI